MLFDSLWWLFGTLVVLLSHCRALNFLVTFSIDFKLEADCSKFAVLFRLGVVYLKLCSADLRWWIHSRRDHLIVVPHVFLGNTLSLHLVFILLWSWYIGILESNICSILLYPVCQSFVDCISLECLLSPMRVATNHSLICLCQDLEIWLCLLIIVDPSYFRKV